MTPLLTLDDSGYPAVREIRGLAFPISVLTSATHLNVEQKVDREVHSRRLVTAWNAHDQLVAAAMAAEAVFARQKWSESSTDPEATALRSLRAAIAAATE